VKITFRHVHVVALHNFTNT